MKLLEVAGDMDGIGDPVIARDRVIGKAKPSPQIYADERRSKPTGGANSVLAACCFAQDCSP